ncbi:MAG: hypothetical protein AAFN51_07935, partial [Pseudomonadota bacterium]
VSKNVLTEFDKRLSCYLSAIHGRGLPGASVETRIRDIATGRSWSPYPLRHVNSVPEALALAAQLALGPEPQMRVRMGAWMSEDAPLEQERLITTDTVASLEKALSICALITEPDFLEISGDYDRVLVRPVSSTMDVMIMDLARGTISVPTTSELSGTAYQGPLFGFDAALRQNAAVANYMSKARHAVASAKEEAILKFREMSEDRIHEFDAAIGGRPLVGHRMMGASTLIARLQAGLGSSLLGLSEAAQVTALDWASTVQSSEYPALEADDGSGDGPRLPPGPRLVS